MLQKKYSVLSLVILVSLALTACGGQTAVAEPQTQVTTAPQVDATEAPAEETDQAEGTLPVVDPLSVSGDVVTAGSSTVYPLAEAMAARFEDEGYSGQITIDSIGSGEDSSVFVSLAKQMFPTLPGRSRTARLNLAPQ